MSIEVAEFSVADDRALRRFKGQKPQLIIIVIEDDGVAIRRKGREVGVGPNLVR
jgi:hypothetical protein